MKKRILVTGGCGFVGSNFVRHLLGTRPSYEVINIDCLSYSANRHNLSDIEGDPRYRFVCGNITDGELVRSIVAECQAIVHLAAESHVDRSIQDSTIFVKSNVEGTQQVLEAARIAWCTDAKARKGRFLYVSTDEVYGSLPLDDPELRFNESSLLAPSNPYSATKAAGELLVHAYHRTFGLDVVTTRSCNNFGPYQFPEKLIPLSITSVVQGKTVPLYGDGLNIRDWMHVLDHCDGILGVLENGRTGQVYNISAGNERSNLELTQVILTLLGKDKAWIDFIPDRLGHDRRYSIDSRKIRQELHWRPQHSDWPHALQVTVQWYLDHPAWWTRLAIDARNGN